MTAELLALLAACCYASAHVAIKFGTGRSSLLVGLVITQATGILALGGFAAVTIDNWGIPLAAVGLFALAGVLGPGIGRSLGMRSVRDAGTTVAVPVQASATPVLSTVAGVVVFHETVGVGRIVALGLIVAGIWFCVRGGSANRPSVVDAADISWSALLKRVVVIVPLLSGAAYSGTDVVRKFALATHDDAIVGALIGLITAFVTWSVILVVTVRRRQVVRLSRELGWFCLSGVLSAGAQVALMSALRVGDLSTVAPIVASQPVIVIILGAALLRKLERLRLGTVAGAAVAFVGVAYLSLG